MRIGIVSDAWRPQVNGVVTTLMRTAETLRSFGHEVHMMTPEGLRTIPCPSYPEIRLALFQGRRVTEWLEESRVDALHVATEGPLGLAARRAALRAGLRFTTSYHTQFPQYLRARYPVPEVLTYRALRWFHAPAARTMVGTRQVRRELRRYGFRHLAYWTRGVDTDLFKPGVERFSASGGPVLVYVGPVSVEKSVEDFCRIRRPGRKIVIGDGPALPELKARYPEVLFTGFLFGEALAALLASADCFVFPSRTDTFGLVMLEAMACGLPIAAYPVTGPIDVVREGVTGCLRTDLDLAVEGALQLDRGACRAQALEYGWDNATRQFIDNLVEVRATACARRPSRSALRVERVRAQCP